MGAAVRKSLRLCKQRQARTQKMRGNSQLLRSFTSVVVARPIAEINL